MQKVIFGILVFVAVLALVGGGFAGGFFTGSLTSSHNNDIISPIPSGNQSEETPASEPGETIDFDIIQEVLNILVSNFYGELPDAKTMAYGAIRGMLLTLDDPYTSFIEPKIAAGVRGHRRDGAYARGWLPGDCAPPTRSPRRGCRPPGR
jgi:carboxyl-terminal processing protease